MSQEKNTFDAIVIGAGMSGGWASKELCEAGLKTVLLERGRNVEHLKDYPTTNLRPWEFEHRGGLTAKERKENPIVSRCYAFREDAKHFFVKDDEHPYIQDKPFDWLRGYQVGGKSIMWARQVQRWSDFDFEGPARDGFSVDWPIRYKDIAPYYSQVEKFIGVSGSKDGIDTLPDGEFLKPFETNCVEEYFSKVIEESYDDRHVIYGRCAHLSESKPEYVAQGRGRCMSRTVCQRGCPFGGYFNSNSTVVPAAMNTGNLTMRTHSVVHSVLFDEELNKAVGVRIIDSNTNEQIDYYASIVFVTAATLNTNLILLNSKSKRYPNGLGNDHGLLGTYVAFHNYRATISGEYDGFADKTTEGKKPTSHYIPRFRNVYKQETDFLRGYAAGFGANPIRETSSEGIGEELKNNLFASHETGKWRVGSHMMGETIPKASNRVYLDETKVDRWGIPMLHIDIDYDENDEKMIQDFFREMTSMFEKAGFTNIKTNDNGRNPGNDIHEMGGVRMGKDPKTSMLNEWNQMHLCKNVFVTDGACMTSTSTQNPSLTFMALSARAAQFAAKEFKEGRL